MDSNPTTYLIFKSILGFIYLILLSPFFIRRLNDIGASPWWIMVIFVSYSFELRNIFLIDHLWGITIPPFSTPILILNTSVLILALILFFKAGNSIQQQTTL